MEYICDICEKVCKTEYGLKKHKETHKDQPIRFCQNPECSIQLFNPQQKKFCSRSCSAKITQKGKKHSEDHKRKISEKLKCDIEYDSEDPNCIWCGDHLSENQIKSECVFCSPKCLGEYRQTKRFCRKCGTKLNKDQNEYCSNECQRKHRSGQLTHDRKCKNCNGPLREKNRKYCSNKCKSEHRRTESIRKWLNGELDGSIKTGIADYARTYILEQSNYKCSECGCDNINSFSGYSIIQVDHIDGNNFNNSPENLRALCPNCHAMTETFGSLNKGKKNK